MLMKENSICIELTELMEKERKRKRGNEQN